MPDHPSHEQVGATWAEESAIHQFYKILETVLIKRRFQCFVSFLPLYKQEVKVNQTGDYSDG